MSVQERDKGEKSGENDEELAKTEYNWSQILPIKSQF